VLVDAGGPVQGIRVVTDNRVNDRERRAAAALIRNFKARFTDGRLDYGNVVSNLSETHAPMNAAPGSASIAQCAWQSTQAICAKVGHSAVNSETQGVNKGLLRKSGPI
jgi:hypothetical protein